MNLTEKYATFSKRSYMRAALCVKNSQSLLTALTLGIQPSLIIALIRLTTCIQEKKRFLAVCHLAL